MLIGRKKELKLLNTICEVPKSQLVVIYGRRRIGKTYLVDYRVQIHKGTKHAKSS